MIVGVDLEKLKVPNSGLGQFAYHLAAELPVSDFDFNYYIPKEYSGKFGSAVQYTQWNRLHQLGGIPLKCDLWHSIHQEAKYFPRQSKARILTIHDLNFLHKYEGAKRRWKLQSLQKLVRDMDGFTFISNYTRDICNEELKFDDKPQKVIYNGLAIREDVGPLKPRGVDTDPFLFTIGIISAKKNFHVLLPAMKLMPEFKLYIAGSADTGYGGEIKDEIAKLGLEEQVKLLGSVSEAEKNWLYQHCSAFVFPSLAEGFGLPVIEAMHYGKPVITSDKTSLPEIGNGHTTLLDNFEAEYISNRITSVIESFTNDKAEELKAYAGSFSWEKAAKEYREFYKGVSTTLDLT